MGNYCNSSGSTVWCSVLDPSDPRGVRWGKREVPDGRDMCIPMADSC